LLGEHHAYKIGYKQFSIKAEEEVEDFVEGRQNHPVKQKTLAVLEQDAVLPSRFSLLDIGCGPGVLAHMILRQPGLCGRISYTGVDQSQPAIGYCLRKYPDTYKFVCRDVFEKVLPEEDFDVIAVNEVVEHIDGYDKIISMAIDKNPKIIVLNTFAVLPELDRDRLLWLRGTQCFMNSYSVSKFFCYLREKTKAPIQIFDFGTQLFNRYWFPRKALIGW